MATNKIQLVSASNVSFTINIKDIWIILHLRSLIVFKNNWVQITWRFFFLTQLNFNIAIAITAYYTNSAEMWVGVWAR